MDSRTKPILITSVHSEEPVPPEVELLSKLMDSVFTLPGSQWRFGLDPLLGLFPGVGDLVTSLISLYILSIASRLRVPRITLVRMALNVMIDSLGGSLPIIGDLFDVWWKSNTRNVALLRQALLEPDTTQRRARTSDWFFVGAVGLVIVAISALSVWCCYLILQRLMLLAAAAG